MKNNEEKPRRFSCVEVILVIGHLVIVAGLWVSAFTVRPNQAPLLPAISILDSLEEGGEAFLRK